MTDVDERAGRSNVVAARRDARLRRRRRRLAAGAVAGLFALSVTGFLGLQATFAVGAENRCTTGVSDSSRYVWAGLEWQWSGIPGVHCTWNDRATCDEVSAWAWGRLPPDLREAYLGPHC